MNESKTIKIEKGVPFPNRNPSSKYTIIEMKVGDSFVVENLSKAVGARLAIMRMGWKCCQQAQLDGSVRIWRKE